MQSIDPPAVVFSITEACIFKPTFKPTFKLTSKPTFQLIFKLTFKPTFKPTYKLASLPGQHTFNSIYARRRAV